MVLSLKGWIHFVPLWRRQVRGDLDTPELSLIPQLFTCLITSYSLLTFFPSLWLKILLLRLNLTPSPLILILSNPLLNLLISSTVATVSVSLLLYLSKDFEFHSLPALFRIFQERTFGAGYEGTADLLLGFALGVVAGIIYLFVAVVPTFLFGFFIFFFFVPFMSIEFSFLFALVFSTWFMVVLLFLLRGRLSDPPPPPPLPTEYPMTERVREILESEEEPVVCEACRSMFSVERRSCPVCGEERY